MAGILVLRDLQDRMREILRSSQDLTPWVATWIYEVKELEDEKKSLVAMLEDVPGDTLEQKVQRMFHEMEQAHKRLQY